MNLKKKIVSLLMVAIMAITCLAPCAVMADTLIGAGTNEVAADAGVMAANSPAKNKITSASLHRSTYTYGGYYHKPANDFIYAVVNGKSVTLKAGSDYTYSYKNAAGTKVSGMKDAGSYSVVIKFIGKYAGNSSRTLGVKVNKATPKLSANTSLTASFKTLKKGSVSKALAPKSNPSGAKITCSKVSGSKKLTVKGSKITVKKGTAKGTYTCKVKLAVKSSKNFNSASKTIKVTVKVK